MAAQVYVTRTYADDDNRTLALVRKGVMKAWRNEWNAFSAWSNDANIKMHYLDWVKAHHDAFRDITDKDVTKLYYALMGETMYRNAFKQLFGIEYTPEENLPSRQAQMFTFKPVVTLFEDDDRRGMWEYRRTYVTEKDTTNQNALVEVEVPDSWEGVSDDQINDRYLLRKTLDDASSEITKLLYSVHACEIHGTFSNELSKSYEAVLSEFKEAFLEQAKAITIISTSKVEDENVSKPDFAAVVTDAIKTIGEFANNAMIYVRGPNNSEECCQMVMEVAKTVGVVAKRVKHFFQGNPTELGQTTCSLDNTLRRLETKATVVADHVPITEVKGLVSGDHVLVVGWDPELPTDKAVNYLSRSSRRPMRVINKGDCFITTDIATGQPTREDNIATPSFGQFDDYRLRPIRNYRNIPGMPHEVVTLYRVHSLVDERKYTVWEKICSRLVGLLQRFFPPFPEEEVEMSQDLYFLVQSWAATHPDASPKEINQRAGQLVNRFGVEIRSIKKAIERQIVNQSLEDVVRARKRYLFEIVQILICVLFELYITSQYVFPTARGYTRLVRDAAVVWASYKFVLKFKQQNTFPHLFDDKWRACPGWSGLE